MTPPKMVLTSYYRMDRPLIDDTVKRINESYSPGTLAWMKKSHRKDCARRLTVERHINEMALEGDQEGLRGALEEYQGIILDMVGVFKAPQGDLFESKRERR